MIIDNENCACENCTYWNPIESEYGTCSRYAPRPTMVRREQHEDVACQWPVTQWADFCGDFKGAAE